MTFETMRLGNRFIQCFSRLMKNVLHRKLKRGRTSRMCVHTYGPRETYCNLFRCQKTSFRYIYIIYKPQYNCPLINVNFLRKKKPSIDSYFVITRLQVVRELVPGKILKRRWFIFDTLDTNNFLWINIIFHTRIILIVNKCLIHWLILFYLFKLQTFFKKFLKNVRSQSYKVYVGFSIKINTCPKYHAMLRVRSDKV